MKIGIVDTYSLSKNGKIYGHYSKTAKQYSKVLGRDNEIYIIGGKGYKKILDTEKFLELPYSVNVDSNYTSIFKKIIKYIGCFVNALIAFSSNCDVLIFQDSNRNLVSLLLAVFPTTKKYFFIRYSEDYGSKRKYQKKAYKKLSGVITSLENVAICFDCKSLIIPDYLPDYDIMGEEALSVKYDVAVVGTVTDEKDYEMVVRAFNNSEYNIIIAGNFRDKKRLNTLISESSSNIEIVDSYLDEAEYERIIRCSRYIMLPYLDSKIPKSSGVVLDALYRHVPVIVPDNKAFTFIKEKNLGITYHNTIDIDNLMSNYAEHKSNSIIFTDQMNAAKDKLYKFICF